MKRTDGYVEGRLCFSWKVRSDIIIIYTFEVKSLMKRLFDTIKNHPFITILIGTISVVLLIIGVPILIHILFKTSAVCDWFVPEWEAGNVLEYYGAILGFLGTVTLSILALYQNYELKNEADEKE